MELFAGLSRCKGAILVAVLLAAALRFPSLASRPMHADEAIHADKLGTLLEGGGYAYDRSEYHGPSLYYLTLPSAWLGGTRRYADISEVTLRAVPAILGVALVAAHLGARAYLGNAGAALAALLVALSPAMVYFSRSFIHEIPLVLFTFSALLGAGRYARKPGSAPALLTGTSVGLMLATKETASLALGSMALALALTLFAERRLGRALPPRAELVRGRDALLALLAAGTVAGLLFSSFLTHPQGIVDSVRAYGVYLDRAAAAAGHEHPWAFYLRLLIHFPSSGTPVWTEIVILILAVLGGVAGWTERGIRGADPRILRFLGFYTLVLLVSYSAIPYKTPWCLLGFLHGMILLAGAGAMFVVRAARGAAMKWLAAVTLLCAFAHLGWQAFAGSFHFAADPRNPYVYAQTGEDVFLIARRVRDLARAHPAGLAVPLQIISRENLWPLPWYLRGLSNVAWWNGVSPDAAPAPVVILTPDMEESLVDRLYEQPPPGERELYVSIFDRTIELRPGVELRGYVARSLSEAASHRQGDVAPPRSE